MVHKLTLLSLLGASLCAQDNPFIVFPQDPERQAITSATFVRRPNWNLAAEAHQQLSAAWFRGIGDNGAACVANGFYHWAADENIATAETYEIVLRSADPLGNPDPTAAGVILQVPALTTPSNALGGRGSWIITDGFASPVSVPCTQTWFQGIGMAANPLWPASDGYSLWAADSPAISPSPLVGENHRPGAPSILWSVDAVANTAAARAWTCIFGVLVDAPVLHLGGIDPTSSRSGTLGAPSYGMNGLFPTIPNDGLNARVHDWTAAQGIALLAVSLDYMAPISFGFPGNVYLDLGTTTTVGFALMSNGAGTIPIATPGSLPASAVGVELKFQSMVFNLVTGAGRFSNAQTTLF